MPSITWPFKNPLATTAGAVKSAAAAPMKSPVCTAAENAAALAPIALIVVTGDPMRLSPSATGNPKNAGPTAGVAVSTPTE